MTSGHRYLECFGQQVCPRLTVGVPVGFLSFTLLGLFAATCLTERRHGFRRIAERNRA